MQVHGLVQKREIPAGSDFSSSRVSCFYSKAKVSKNLKPL